MKVRESSFTGNQAFLKSYFRVFYRYLLTVNHRLSPFNMTSRDQTVSASEDLPWKFRDNHRHKYTKSIFDVHRSKTSLLKLNIAGFSIDSFCCPLRKKLLSPQSLPQRRHMHRDWWVLHVRMCTGIQRKELRKWVSTESVNSVQLLCFSSVFLASLTVLKASLLCVLCSSPLCRAFTRF